MKTMNKRTLSKNDKNLHWTLLHEKRCSLLDQLLEIYDVDKEKARIFYFLNNPTNDFSITSVILFEEKNGDFRIVRSIKRHGISSTGKRYITKRTVGSVSYNKKTGFHHYTNEYGKGFVQQLNYQLLHNFSNYIDNGFRLTPKDNIIIDYMVKRFGWIRNVGEMDFGITFNVIRRKKLFNTRALFRYQYGCPYPQAKMVDKYCFANGNGQYIKQWREVKKVLNNIESLKEELYHHPLFHDTCNMAKMVGRKVNCSWSVKRLKSEHDKWSKQVTAVMLETEKLRDLKIKGVFNDFAEYSGFEILRTNHALIEDGVRMNHCVGTYSTRVDSGQCAIYSIMGCTLELSIKKAVHGDEMVFDGLRIGQFMDIGNTKPPSEAIEYVKGKVIDYNSKLDIDNVEVKLNDLIVYEDDEMPF